MESVKATEDSPMHPRCLQWPVSNSGGVGEHNEVPTDAEVHAEDDEPSSEDDDDTSDEDDEPAAIESDVENMTLEELAAQEAPLPPLPSVKMSLLVVGGTVNVSLSTWFDWSSIVESMEAESKCRKERASDNHDEEMKGGSEDGTLHGAEALNPSLLKSMEQVISREIQKPSCLYEPDLNMTMPCPWRGSWDTDKANPNVYMIIATRLRPKPGAASATIRGREPRILIEMGQMVAKHKERLFRHVVSFMLYAVKPEVIVDFQRAHGAVPFGKWLVVLDHPLWPSLCFEQPHNVEFIDAKGFAEWREDRIKPKNVFFEDIANLLRQLQDARVNGVSRASAWIESLLLGGEVNVNPISIKLLDDVHREVVSAEKARLKLKKNEESAVKVRLKHERDERVKEEEAKLREKHALQTAERAAAQAEKEATARLANEEKEAQKRQKRLEEQQQKEERMKKKKADEAQAAKEVEEKARLHDSTGAEIETALCNLESLPTLVSP